MNRKIQKEYDAIVHLTARAIWGTELRLAMVRSLLPASRAAVFFTLLRSIDLPVEEVNTSRATATLNNGILELTAPKAATKSTAIQVKRAGAA